jgi:hypothetical protein
MLAHLFGVNVVPQIAFYISVAGTHCVVECYSILFLAFFFKAQDGRDSFSPGVYGQVLSAQ